MKEGVLTGRPIPGFQKPQRGRSWRNEAETAKEEEEKSRRKAMEVGMKKDRRWPFASVSVERREENNKEYPTTKQYLKHPLALLAFVPREVTVWAGALAGAAAKTLTAPLDCVKLLMQTDGLRVIEGGAKNAIGYIECACLKKWGPHYDEYRAEMCNAMSINDESKKIVTKRIYKKY